MEFIVYAEPCLNRSNGRFRNSCYEICFLLLPLHPSPQPIAHSQHGPLSRLLEAYSNMHPSAHTSPLAKPMYILIVITMKILFQVLTDFSSLQLFRTFRTMRKHLFHFSPSSSEFVFRRKKGGTYGFVIFVFYLKGMFHRTYSTRARPMLR